MSKVDYKVSTPPTEDASAQNAATVNENHDVLPKVEGMQNASAIRAKNRRMTWLQKNPDYFSHNNLELADPLLYDRLIRRFQSAAEREAEGRRKGFSGILEADILRGEAKIAALSPADSTDAKAQKRSTDTLFMAEGSEEEPKTKEEGLQLWRQAMEWRFLRGDDTDFDYASVDDNEAYDNGAVEERDEEEKYFDQESPEFVIDHDGLEGETGIQDF